MNSSEILGEGGPLAAVIDDYCPRKVQQQMAAAVERALGDKSVLAVEAGTGVGKTYAYLVPAIKSCQQGNKIIISTGTKALQEQLFNRDLPLLLDILPAGIDCALLKGRSNYLCKNRLQTASAPMFDKKQQADLALIRSWAKTTQTGDVAELSELEENAEILSAVTSDIDYCSSNENCTVDTCFAILARKHAQNADMVVINHHLFMADMALKEEGFGEILPSANAFIFDEAHQLAEVAGIYFGAKISSIQLGRLVKDMRKILAVGLLAEDKTHQLVDEFGRILEVYKRIISRYKLETTWQEIVKKQTVATAFNKLLATIQKLAVVLEKDKELDKAIASLHARCVKYNDVLQSFNELDSSFVYWLQIDEFGFVMQQTPVNVAKLFAAHMQKYLSAWVFASATLAISANFEHFINSLGLENATTLSLDSPFDYPNNSILYLPMNLPQPQEQDFLDKMFIAIQPVLAASKGRAFMLFTSYRALDYMAQKMQDETDYPLFVQKTAPRSRLLDDFRRSGNGVLLGTSSFWEGVDIKGDALSCVIIDKLPFAAPNDPVLKARVEELQKQGRNAFMEYQLPQAIIALKQGVGRLIRDGSDRGVVVVCDIRLKTKFYGRRFSNSLPPMKRSRTLSEVESFFTQ